METKQRDLSGTSASQDESELRTKLRRKFYFACFTHGLIVLYGLAVFAVTILH